MPCAGEQASAPRGGLALDETEAYAARYRIARKAAATARYRDTSHSAEHARRNAQLGGGAGVTGLVFASAISPVVCPSWVTMVESGGDAFVGVEDLVVVVDRVARR